MMYRTTSRGSAFILVVGVMVALAMVGSIFFLTALSDKRESVAMTEAVSIRPMADMIVQELRVALAEDLHIGANGPYSDGSPEWNAYIDYPSPDGKDPNDADTEYPHLEDLHLSSIERAWADGPDVSPDRRLMRGDWPRITILRSLLNNVLIPGRPAVPAVKIDPAQPCIYGANDTDGDGAREFDLNGDGTEDINAWASNPITGQPDECIPLVDTDRDGVRDAILFPTRVYADDGEEYYAAVRVIDLSGLVNINAAHAFLPTEQIPEAGGADMMTQTMLNPMNIPLNLRLDNSDPPSSGIRMNEQFHLDKFDTFIATRTTPTLEQMFTEFVRRLENPLSTEYRAYDLSDELACRLGGQSRLADAVKSPNPTDWDKWNYYSRHLTALSASREIPRTPGQGEVDWECPRYKVDVNMSLADKEIAFHEYRRAFYGMFGGGNKKIVCQMALNLIDYRDGDATPTVATDGDWLSGLGVGSKLAGVEPQPFITEVWYAVTKYTPPTPSKTWMAIVLYNPYDFQIDMDNWSVKVGSNSPETFSGSISARGRFVLHHSSEPGAPVQIAGGVGSADISVLDPEVLDAASPDNEIRILRPGEDAFGAPNAVLVGLINKDDFDNASVDTPALQPDGGATSRVRLIRDDKEDEFRSSVAYYLGEDPAPSYDLGLASAGTQIGEIWPDIPATPIFVRGYDGGDDRDLVNIGEISRLLTFGPDDADGPIDVQLGGQYDDVKTDDELATGIGRMDSWSFNGVKIDGVPASCRASDFFTIHSPLYDGVDNDGDGVTPGMSEEQLNREKIVYGKLNINTATLGALCSLPLCSPNALGLANWNPGSTMDNFQSELLTMAGEIVAYRDRLGPITLFGEPPGSDIGNEDYSSNADRLANVSDKPKTVDDSGGLRDDPGFAAAGEIGVPLRRFHDISSPPFFVTNFYGTPSSPMGWAYFVDNNNRDDGFAVADLNNKSDLAKREMRYAYVSNLVTANSDTYCAYIYIQKGIGSGSQPETAHPQRFVVILDRSNCIDADDLPEVRAFAQIE